MKNVSEKVLCYIMMAENMKENGKMIINSEKDTKYILLEIDMKVIL